MTKEINQEFTSDEEGSFDSDMESNRENSNNSIFDLSRLLKSEDETHSTPEIDFEQLKDIIMLLYRDFTTGQENAYIHNELDYIEGKNISKQFWLQMNSALTYCCKPSYSQKTVELIDAFDYLSWVIGEAVDISYDDFGDYFLSPTSKIIEDAVCFYLKSDKNEFCNFIELSFKQKAISKELYAEKGNQLVKVFNGIFSLYGHQLELTPFVYEYRDWNDRIVLKSPKVISKAEPMYKEAVEPALSVLRASGFRQANIEFIGALRDYRNEDFSDCLTKCGSAFESVLIDLSDKLNIPGSKSKRKVGDRLNLIVKHLKLDRSLIPVLNATAVLRNNLSSAHGRGENVISPSPHVAQYAINCTASAILLLVKEFNS